MPELKDKANCSVCDMEVGTEQGLNAEYKGHSYYFCSDSDKKKFMKNPERYIGKEHMMRAAQTASAAVRQRDEKGPRLCLGLFPRMKARYGESIRKDVIRS